MNLFKQWPKLSLQLKAFLCLTLASHMGLLVLFSAHSFLRPQYMSWTILLAQCIPLLLFIPGMLAIHRRTYLWLCFIILLYFVKAVLGFMASTANIFDSIFLILSCSLFVGAMLSAREIYKAGNIKTDEIKASQTIAAKN